MTPAVADNTIKVGEAALPAAGAVAVPPGLRVVPARPGAARRPAAWYAGRLIGYCMRLVPRRYRFGFAVRVAGGLALAMRGTRAFGKLSNLRLNSPRDIALHLLLSSMTACGTEFDLPLRVEGQEVLQAALDSGEGTLIVAPHALLSLLILRYLHDRGHAPTIIARQAGMPLAGTSIVAPTVFPSSTVLLVVRGRLREGGIVCAMVDRLGTTGKQTREFDSQVGQLRVSDSIFRVAARCDARVIFTIARAEKGSVRLALAAPAHASAGHPEAIAGDFISFVQEHALSLS